MHVNGAGGARWDRVGEGRTDEDDDVTCHRAATHRMRWAGLVIGGGWFVQVRVVHAVTCMIADCVGFGGATQPQASGPAGGKSIHA
jgi:hypothetical protein